jgi:adenylate cyclase
VREHVGNRIDLAFEDLGPQTLKNIDRPVRAHRLLLAGMEGASAAIIAGPWRARADRTRPSVAVLPFENLSRDPDRDYFGEGIAEDLITDLSKISGLQIAGRRTTFASRQTARDAVETSARLQVGHVLEGSVRHAGNRIRITARLVDGATGVQVWAERYDRTLDDIFAVQDDITNQIVTALKVKLLPTEKEALARTPTNNIEAYGDYLRGLELLASHVKPSYTLARRMFVRAVELDPNFARALAGIAECDCDLYMHFDGQVSFDDVLATTERALQLEPDLASAHASRGVALLATDRAEEAERSFQHAIAAEPDYAMAHYFYGRACVLLGRKQEAVRLLRRAADLAPDDVGLIGPSRDLIRGTRYEEGGRGDLARGPGAMRTGTRGEARSDRRGLQWRRRAGVPRRTRASLGLGQARARDRPRRPPDALQCCV